MMKRLRLSSDQVQYLSWAGIALLFIVLGTIILSFETLFPTSDSIQLAIGDVAQEDIFAPYDITYQSDVLLAERRRAARESASVRYIDLPNVRDNQRMLMDAFLDYIDLVRENPYTSQEEKVNDLMAIEVLTISESRWRTIVAFEDSEWRAIATEARQLLDRTIERRIITDADVQRELTDLDIRGSFSQSEDLIITAMVEDLIVPTEAVDEELTRIAQDNAAAAITADLATISLDANDPIVFRRDTVTAQQIEILQQYNLLYQRDRIEENIIGAAMAMMLVVVVGSLYLRRFYAPLLNDYVMLTMLAFLFIEFLFLARFFVSSASTLPSAALVFPSAALALLYMSLAGPHLATVGTLGLGLLIGLLIPDADAIEFAMIVTAGGFASILAMDNQERTSDYFSAALMITIANFLMYGAVIMVRDDTPTFVDLIAGLLLAAVGGVFAAGIAFVQLGIISTIMNLPTSIRLIDLMRPDQPALKQLLREAPGTFQHSLQVANLAELAAERIAANTTLVRVAAMYHDIGKTLNPYFFVENQKGFNPHDTINDPQRSAKILISHVTEGDRMARRYRLPRRIRDFIREHHGTSKPFFYYKALELAGGDESKVNAEDYTYPGPAPRSKETGILKLADSIESAARSIQPKDRAGVTEVVDMIFQKELQDNQLDNSTLTLNDLKEIREVFIDTLEGIYHTRIKYPGQDKAKLAEGEPKALEEGQTQTKVATSTPTAEEPAEPVVEPPARLATEPNPTKPKRKTREVPVTDHPPVSEYDENSRELPSEQLDNPRARAESAAEDATKRKTKEETPVEPKQVDHENENRTEKAQRPLEKPTDDKTDDSSSDT